MLKKIISNPIAGFGPMVANHFNVSSGQLLRFIQVVIFLVFTAFPLFSQSTAETREQLIEKLNSRSEKIVSSLSLNDPDKSQKLVSVISRQYLELNSIHDSSRVAVNRIKSGELTKEESARLIGLEENKKQELLKKLHASFLEELAVLLNTADQEKIKDGMTYNVLHVTYNAYQDMIPSLTEGQKEKIYNWLKEARELAMDEGSSDDKHKVFGKYKGRINNYLSAEGYDMKKEEKAWQERIKNSKQ